MSQRVSLFLVLAVLGAVACGGTALSRNPADGGPSVPDGGGATPSGAAEGGSRAGPDGGPTCVPQDGEYTCLGVTLPVCPSGAIPDQPCDNSVPSCMGCSQGAGFTCSCADAGLVPQQDGALWNCIGTEYTCE